MSWRPSWISDRQTIPKFSTGPANDHSCKGTIQLAWWFLTRRFLKFQLMKTHYGPWQPCCISNQHQKHKSGRGPSNEHFWQIWFNSVQWFQRRRFKCEKLTDGRQMLTLDKSSHGLWPGELKNHCVIFPLNISINRKRKAKGNKCGALLPSNFFFCLSNQCSVFVDWLGSH